jgi:hypothetical protein
VHNSASKLVSSAIGGASRRIIGPRPAETPVPLPPDGPLDHASSGALTTTEHHVEGAVDVPDGHAHSRWVQLYSVPDAE